MPKPLTATQQVVANLKLLRTRRGWTQAEMARQASTSENRVWGLETGKRRLTVDDMAGFADAFGVTPERMLSDSPESNGEPEEIAVGTPVYEVAMDGGLTQTCTADSVDLGETWASFSLNGTPVFLAPTARVLSMRLRPEGAPDVR